MYDNNSGDTSIQNHPTKHSRAQHRYLDTHPQAPPWLTQQLLQTSSKQHWQANS